MPNIMKLRAEAQNLIALMDEADMDFTPEIEQGFQQLSQLGQAGVAICGDIIDELTARATARKNRAKELSDLAKRDESSIDSTKRQMMLIMDTLGTKKVAIGGLTVTKSDGRESVEIIDENLVPDKYKKATITFPAHDLEVVRTLTEIQSEKVEISKTAIMADHKASKGEIGVAGVNIVKNPYLLIKGAE